MALNLGTKLLFELQVALTMTQNRDPSEAKYYQTLIE